MKDFGKRLRQARKAAGMTQSQLARESGLSCHGVVSNIEIGRNLPNLYTAVQMANTLDISLDWLAGRDKK